MRKNCFDENTDLLLTKMFLYLKNQLNLLIKNIIKSNFLNLLLKFHTTYVGKSPKNMYKLYMWSVK